ncbi:MAG: DUF3877 family protein [Clostridiales bacterium]|nr:DUF3877 family protein [Clostridiales bacterium]
MNFKDLEKNIIDTITEQQIKLGYERETVGLYYPAASIRNLLNQKEYSLLQIDAVLEEFSKTVKDTLGEIIIERDKDRYCIKVLPQGSAYIHSIIEEQSFLVRFIRAISLKECTLEKLMSIFYEFSDCVNCKKMEGEEFDFALSFQDDSIDPYYYCVKTESHHMTYHRFTKSDYRDMDFL